MNVEFLTKEDIVFINQRTIAVHGGNYVPPQNFLNENNLDFLIETISAEVFGQYLYPKLTDKAALYCYNIIANHIFTDGNKRTGLEAALAFLQLNGHRISNKLSHLEIINFIIKIASGQSSIEECKLWFALNTIEF